MPAAPPKSVSVSGAVALTEIPQGNTLENSGKQNPKMGFKSPRSKTMRDKWFIINNLNGFIKMAGRLS